jgi:N-acyl-D-aspartate/D-glutamate deacylase
MLDCVISGGTVVDGTGAERFRADVGVRDGRIVAIGPVDEPAARRVDADGLVVAPGFVDIHTHYDAQVFWNPSLSPSVLHGVTTVIGGNCGFTIAPMEDEHADYLARLLAVVEGMPLDSLQVGVPWGKWRSFGEYLDLIDGTTTINCGFLVGHSTVRRLAMGQDAHEANPTEAQLDAMERLVRESLAAGALGFSTSNGSDHLDGDNQWVPSRCAGDRELFRLCRAVADYPGTTLEYIPTSAAAEAERMIGMSLSGRRPVNWNVLVVTASRRARVEQDLAVSDLAAARGAQVFALTAPVRLQSRRNFITGFSLSAIPGWDEVFTLEGPARVKALSDPATRVRLLNGAERVRETRPELIDWPKYVVEEAFAPSNATAQGRTIADLAAERGTEPFDALLDVVVADELRTILLCPAVSDDPESRALQAATWRDERVVLGGSDAGAHLDMLTAFVYFTEMLGLGVRERQLIGLEEAVHLLADKPARLYGLRDRGRIALGAFADLVLFDPDKIAPGPVATAHDLPGGAWRLFAGAAGIEHVFVNGVEVVHSNDFTGERGGRLLRSGRDTDTVFALA